MNLQNALLCKLNSHHYVSCMISQLEMANTHWVLMGSVLQSITLTAGHRKCEDKCESNSLVGLWAVRRRRRGVRGDGDKLVPSQFLLYGVTWPPQVCVGFLLASIVRNEVSSWRICSDGVLFVYYSHITQTALWFTNIWKHGPKRGCNRLPWEWLWWICIFRAGNWKKIDEWHDEIRQQKEGERGVLSQQQWEEGLNYFTALCVIHWGFSMFNIQDLPPRYKIRPAPEPTHTFTHRHVHKHKEMQIDIISNMVFSSVPVVQGLLTIIVPLLPFRDGPTYKRCLH